MSNKIARFGVMVALALIFSYIESLIPINFGIPGIKLGLANLVIVVALYMMDTPSAYILSVTRVLTAGFMFGNMMIIVYSLVGGLLSLSIMAILKKINKNSLIAISIAGGVFHNIGQLIVAAITLETLQISYYAPILIISGLITGLVIGVVAEAIIKRIRKVWDYQ
ncbi:MAG: Gx transporter family protein [Suipraeoptans sp.]